MNAPEKAKVQVIFAARILCFAGFGPRFFLILLEPGHKNAARIFGLSRQEMLPQK